MLDISKKDDRNEYLGKGPKPLGTSLSLAGNKAISCRPDAIRKIYDISYNARKELATNPAIRVTPDIAEKLFNDSNNPSIQEDILMNPAIMEINSIKEKLIKHVDDYISKGISIQSQDYFDWSKLRNIEEGGYKPGFLNLRTTDILFKLAKNPDLYKDKQLFDKVYKESPDDIISFNPNIFDRSDVVDTILKSDEFSSELQLLATNKHIVNHIDVINRMRNIPSDQLQRNLYESISFSIQSDRREGIQTNQEIKKIHKVLYYKLYPGQYTYEDANPFD